MLKMPSMKKHYLRLSRNELDASKRFPRKTFRRVEAKVVDWRNSGRREIVKKIKRDRKAELGATRFAKAFGCQQTNYL